MEIDHLDHCIGKFEQSLPGGLYTQLADPQIGFGRR